MDKAVVKPGHMSEIDNKAPMGLKEHAGREPVEPILHILYGVMIFLDRMNDDLMIYGFHRYNMCGENRAHAILRFNGKRVMDFAGKVVGKTVDVVKESPKETESHIHVKGEPLDQPERKKIPLPVNSHRKEVATERPS